MRATWRARLRSRHAASTRRILTRGWDACWSRRARWSARAGMRAPAKRTPKCWRGARAGAALGWISGEESREDVQRLRARSSAVLTGAGTVRADDPRLNVRLDYGSWVRQSLRVLLDPALSCRANSKIFHEPGPVLIFAAEDAPRGSHAAI